MDVGLYREDEQFSFSSSYMDTMCEQNELYEEIRPMPEPPNQLFEWYGDDAETQLSDDNNIHDEVPNMLGFSGWPPMFPIMSVAKSDQFETETNSKIPISPTPKGPRSLISPPTENNVCRSNRTESESSDNLNASFSSTELTNFDIAEYVFEENKQTLKSITSEMHIKEEPKEHTEIKSAAAKFEPPKRTIKAGVKKIDLKAQKYIVESDIKKSFSEDELVDIETVSEGENSPVLEAGNLTDLLEQFEATEIKNEQPEHNQLRLNVKLEVNDVHEMAKPVIKIEPQSNMKNIKSEPLKAQEGLKHQGKGEPLYINNNKDESSSKSNVASSKPPISSSNRQIIDSLPQELINRIKETGKRKPITVIQAIPNNRKRSRIQEPPKVVPRNISNSVYLDHNYCSLSSPLSKIIKKDSFEEDDKSVINRQPTVKNADGTLMVSLLKANTIRQIDPSSSEKKKLNLEEYKKRRNGILTPKNNSQNCSPIASTCSSPVPEDEHQKMLKHQEKLRKMAQEVLNAAPKSEKKVDLQPGSPTLNKDSQIKIEPTINGDSSIPEDAKKNVCGDAPKLPPNLERKIFVSFGVNTNFKMSQNEDSLASVERVQEIKPLLEKSGDKFSDNSLIKSVIESIPKVLSKNDKSVDPSTTQQKENYEHGECKQVVYLEIDRPKCDVKDAATQTNISLIEHTKRGRARRRTSSSSSCSSYTSSCSAHSRRRSSNSSSSSRGSVSSCCPSSSSSSYSRDSSRSRSRSPKYAIRRRNSSAEREHLSAVEERRIIYVGKIESSTTKQDLRRKFQKFGPITKISLHFREAGKNYGFVTFKYKEDAHEAYEHGNDDRSFPFYKISFGGRRQFCKVAYSDLDNVRDDAYYHSQASADSYDELLKEALEKLKRRKV